VLSAVKKERNSRGPWERVSFKRGKRQDPARSRPGCSEEKAKVNAATGPEKTNGLGRKITTTGVGGNTAKIKRK